MLVSPLLGDPLDPPPIQDPEMLMAQILEHPEHAPFIAPVIEWGGIHDDVTVVADSQAPQLLLHPGKIGVQKSLGGRSRIAEVVPGCADGSGNMAAEGIGSLAADGIAGSCTA